MEKVAMFTHSANDLNDEVNEEAIEQAYSDILRISPYVLGYDDVQYKIVTRDL